MDLLGVENGPNTLTLQLRFKQSQMFSNFCSLFTSLPSHDLVYFLHSLLISTRRRCKKYITKVCRNQHYHRCNFIFLFCKFLQLVKIKRKLQRVQKGFFFKKKHGSELPHMREKNLRSSHLNVELMEVATKYNKIFKKFYFHA
jgi:hypothetical protein